MQIKKAGIIRKHDSDLPRQIGAEISAWLNERGVAVEIDRISEDMDILVILGGDGTLLHVADQAARYRIPVVGVNLGSLGFLTEIAVKDRYEALERIMTGPVVVEDRSDVQGSVARSDGHIIVVLCLERRSDQQG